MTISLSTTTQDLISQLSAKHPSLIALLQNQTTIDRTTLLAWFDQTSNIKSDNEAFFLITSLQASLLNDLNQSLNPRQQQQDTQKTGMSAKVKYGLLALAGTVYFGCEGFDGISAIMGIFSSVPTIAIFAAGTLFSILSVIVFYSFDLVEISKNLGVTSSEAPQLLDVLIEEFKQIKAIRARLAKNANDKTKEELEEDLKIAKMLSQRHLELTEARDSLTSALDNPYLKAGKYATAAIAGIIFFSGGFFAGQTVSLAIAALFVTTMTATAWPIVVASIVVGLAALSVYWFVERPGIENLISRWRGLDKEKIDKLCKSDVVDKETEKLNELITSLNSQIMSRDEKKADKSKIEMLEQQASRVGELEQEKSVLEAEKEKYRLKAEAAEKRASALNSELVQLKETLQQTEPKVEPTGHEDHVNDPDTITVTEPLHPPRESSVPSTQRQCSFFRMKKSVSAGNLLDLARQEHSTPKWI